MSYTEPEEAVLEDGERVVLCVHVERVGRSGHNRRLTGRFRWIVAPPHVRRWYVGTSVEVMAALALNGFIFTVERWEEEISLLDFASSAR